MGFAEAEQWWEAWQLRFLVLGSLLLQFFLFLAAALRRRRTPPWFWFLTWVAYQGSDALAIYALATLFNRRGEKQGSVSPMAPGSSSGLEALWAPILLLHLGGRDGMTAYSIQDSELWQRHFLMAASQIVVAVYVFRKSWPRGDKRLLEAAVLLFIPGTLKCLEKPFALWRASISNMATTVGSRTCKIDDYEDDDKAKMEEDISLDEFVREASSVYRSAISKDQRVCSGDHKVKATPHRFFVDIPYPTSIRLANLKYMSKNRDKAHRRVRSSLSKAFNRLYTNYKGYPGAVLRAVLVLLTIVAIRLFNMRRKSYDNADLKVTYVLLSCTAALECISAITMARCRMMSEPPWPDQVAQCSLLRYVAHGKKHKKLRRFTSLLGCEVYLDRLWCTGYLNRFWCTGCLDRLWCASPPRSRLPPPCPDGITELVHDHISSQWRDHIKGNTVAYRRFSDSRGQCTLDKELCNWNKCLMSSLQRPFDESVIIWHLATDFCIFNHVDDGSKENRRCWEISNYMVYLLLVNPEMLMPGARHQIFWTAYDQVRNIIKDKPPEDVDELARTVIHEVKKNGIADSGLLKEAWSLAQELIEIIGKEEKEKMWRVIRGVWVEMLCFSAGRCSGHLHATALGTGGEFLSYVWLLREFMGMETLANTVQRPPDLLADLALPERLPERAYGYWYTGEIAIESQHKNGII